ncbi:homoserine O-acetyltransferase [Allobranchiibius sp. GilTou73]|uniref:homoserine O-acetyltransferase MetX n=1 Tax=Allobranchiibius sp. GilTou73 TaxID=2904523 RepID=UPI001F4295A8|nr:homoserine O-acetyltransferase [Allobranchiibius sp. GilTou73]UIJ33528.1 homoserine O-acetyltransferase [Allobranchiibius sp. GilTou73]
MTVTQQRHRPTPERDAARPADRWVRPPVGTNPASRALLLPEITLESGVPLPQVTVTFQTWGTLNANADNAVLVEHALTGDSHVVGPAGPGQPTAGWWPGLIGPGAPLDTRELFVVASNVLGGCRGTTGPGSSDPAGRPWGARFPATTVRDQVAVEARLADALGIDRWRLVLGGSMGGMRALEWVAGHPDRVDGALIIASTARATADQIAWGQAQALAITSDPDYLGGDYYGHGPGPRQGLGLARRIAHTTYRSAAELDIRFGRDPQGAEDPMSDGRFAVESYLDHQAAKLTARFDAGSYLQLSRAMATHDVTRGRGSLAHVLGAYDGMLRTVAVDSDRLFPVELSQEIVDAHGRGGVHVMSSSHGHDGFLIETDAIAAAVADAVDAVRGVRPREVG